MPSLTTVMEDRMSSTLAKKTRKQWIESVSDIETDEM